MGRPALDGGLRHPVPSAGGGGATRRSSPWSWPWSAASTPARSSTWASHRPCGFPMRCSWPGSRPGARRGAWPGGSACSCVLVSLWWAVGLQVEAAYGVNVLKYTETVPATSGSLPGLGDHPRPRLLVLLRVRPGRALDPDVGRIHPEPLADRRQLRRPRAAPSSPRSSRGGDTAGLLRPDHRGRHGAGGRPQPLHRPLHRRVAHQVASWSTPPPDWPCAPPTGRHPW